jgi:hypothetical protein
MLKRFLAILIFVASGMLCVLHAQSDLASITGTVTDATGAVVPGVQVTVTNTSTGLTLHAVTNDLGFYTVLNLPNGGPYELTAQKQNFSTFKRGSIMLRVGQVAEINAKITVGEQTETMVVTTEAPLLQTETSTLGTSMTSSEVSDLPLNIDGGRSISAFMFAYIPGVEGSDYSSHVNGSLSDTKEVMIDGTSAVSQIGGYLGESQPPMEAVGEFQADTAGISADAGRSGGGVFHYEMKSGTNNLHGSMFGFMHNQAFDANSWWNKYQLATNTAADPSNADEYQRMFGMPTDTMSQWGGSIGGPILKDKLFYFGAFERYMFSGWALGGLSATVPNADFRSGDLSALLDTSTVLGTDGDGNTIYKGSIFDPTTGNVFVNNQIPTTRFSAVSQNILDIYEKYYQPQTTATGANEAGPLKGTPWQHINEGSVKIDYNISEKNRLAGSYVYNSTPRMIYGGGVWSATAVNGGPMANLYGHFVHAPSARASYIHTFTQNLLNTARFTVNRFYNPSKAMSQSGNWDTELGLGSFGAGNFPVVNFDGASYNSDYNMSSLGSQYNDFYAATTVIYNDDVSWVKGRHNFKFGGEYRAMLFNSHGDENVLSVTFDPAQTGAPQASYASSVGHAFASFLLGATNSASVSLPNATYGRRKTLSLYATDNVKITSKLTMDFSLRWDYNNRYKEKNGHWSNFDTSVTNSVTGVKGAVVYLSDGSQSFEKNQDYKLFAPHVGAAYSLDSKTVLRGSASLFYIPLNLNTWGAIPYSFNPGYVGLNRIVSNGQMISTWEDWDTPYSDYATITDAEQNPAYTQWGMVTIDPRSLEEGNTQQWMVGVQRALSKDFSFDGSFIQSHSYHLQSGYLAGNQPKVADYQALAQNGTQWNWVSDEASAAAANVPYPYAGFSGEAYMAITPYPQVAAGWGPQFYVGPPLGNADYQAMQLSVTRRAAHGLSMLASYVLSSTHGDTDTAWSELWWTGSLQNLYDLPAERHTIASFDQKHVIKGYVSYELPIGRGKPFLGSIGRLADALVGGWKVQGDWYYATGSPMQVLSSNYYPGFNAVYSKIVSGCSLKSSFHHLGDAYFNAACFENPDSSTGELGTAGLYLDQLRGFGTASEDFAISKQMRFGPDGRIQMSLRGEAFNVFNRHSYSGADTGMASSNFGNVTSGGGIDPRVGQVGARITF